MEPSFLFSITSRRSSATPPPLSRARFLLGPVASLCGKRPPEVSLAEATRLLQQLTSLTRAVQVLRTLGSRGGGAESEGGAPFESLEALFQAIQEANWDAAASAAAAAEASAVPAFTSSYKWKSTFLKGIERNPNAPRSKRDGGANIDLTPFRAPEPPRARKQPQPKVVKKPPAGNKNPSSPRRTRSVGGLGSPRTRKMQKYWCPSPTQTPSTG